jgi:hypothetical protein
MAAMQQQQQAQVSELPVSAATATAAESDSATVSALLSAARAMLTEEIAELLDIQSSLEAAAAAVAPGSRAAAACAAALELQQNAMSQAYCTMAAMTEQQAARVANVSEKMNQLMAVARVRMEMEAELVQMLV